MSIKSKLKVITDDLATNPRYDGMREAFDSKPFKVFEKVSNVIIGVGVVAGVVLGCIL